MSCPPLTAPNNGMTNCTGNMFEDTCTFSCDQGYELSGRENCQSDRTIKIGNILHNYIHLSKLIKLKKIWVKYFNFDYCTRILNSFPATEYPIVRSDQ